MPIPLVDLKAQHETVASEIRAGWERVLACAHFVLGPELEAFEEAFAAFSDVASCVGVANGTDALELALRAVGVGPGDEVIVPANTFMASVMAVVRTGARPVLVDVDPDYYLIDPDRVRDRLTNRTRAIMPVHLYGQVAPMEQLQAAVDTRDVTIVEDAAQAHGAMRNGRKAAGFGVVAGTSFYPGKNLGSYGDAGALLTTDDGIACTARALRNYGSVAKYEHPTIGFNSRLDELQAVVLNAKLAHLDEWNRRRRAAAERYDELLEPLAEKVQRPQTMPGNEHVWHLYVVRVPARDQVRESLNRAGIGAGVHYPVPTHLHGALRSLGHRPGDFPVTEAAAREILSLPLYPEIRPEQQEEVVRGLHEALR